MAVEEEADTLRGDGEAFSEGTGGFEAGIPSDEEVLSLLE